MYSKKDLTWGFELELSNVPKSFKIPDHLGKWEYCEADIINTKGKYANICADPLGINPPVGGEINTRPSKTKEDQVDRIMEIIEMFKKEGFEPECGMTAHSHIHVHVKGLKVDIKSLKKLVEYVYFNQDFTFLNTYKYDSLDIPEDKIFSKIRYYLKNDGSRKLPEWLYKNIIKHSYDFESFIEMFKKGKDAITSIRPVRYGINLYNLKNTETIEFRCFRGSVDKQELSDCFEFVEGFIINALNNWENVDKILEKKKWKFPEPIFDEDQVEGWYNTKHHVELVKNKNRKFWEAD